MKPETKFKEFVRDRLERDRAWQKRALLALYGLQTKEEQSIQGTVDVNNRGFSGFDGEILSSFAVQLQSRNSLTEKQFALLSKKLPKYWKQIIQISDINKLENYAERVGKAAAAV